MPNIKFKFNKDLNKDLGLLSTISNYKAQLMNLHYSLQEKERKKIKYIIFRTKNKVYQNYKRKNKNINKELGIKIIIIEKLYKEFEKEINKIAKLYNLYFFYFYHPFKTTTKKGILIRMGKGKGKILENKKILEKNKIILILKIIKDLNPENEYKLLQKLNKLNKKYSFLSKLEKIIL